MRLNAVLAVLVLLAASVVAQPGPAPGYASAAEYAADYAASQAENASADPVGYAQAHASESALRNETSHTLYMACWAADDVGAQHEVCDPYYTPRGHEPPEQPPCECNASQAPNATMQHVNSTLNGTQGLVDEAGSFLNDTLSDPANATSHVQRFLGAVVHFAKQAVGGSVALLLWVVGAILTCLGIGVSAFAVAGSGLASLGSLLGDALVLSVQGIGGAGQASAGSAATAAAAVGAAIASAAQAIGQGAAASSSAVGEALATAASATGHAIAVASAAVGHALVVAAKAVGHGFATAAQATGDAFQAMGQAIADAAHSLKDAIAGLWQDDPSQGLDAAGKGLDVDGKTDGLLDGVTGLLP